MQTELWAIVTIGLVSLHIVVWLILVENKFRKVGKAMIAECNEMLVVRSIAGILQEEGRIPTESNVFPLARQHYLLFAVEGKELPEFDGKVLLASVRECMWSVAWGASELRLARSFFFVLIATFPMVIVHVPGRPQTATSSMDLTLIMERLESLWGLEQLTLAPA